MQVLTCEKCGRIFRHKQQRLYCSRACSTQSPTPDEIAAMCEAIRSTWTDAQLVQREGGKSGDWMPHIMRTGSRRRGGVKRGE